MTRNQKCWAVASVIFGIYWLAIVAAFIIGPKEPEPKQPPAGQYSVPADARYPGLTVDY